MDWMRTTRTHPDLAGARQSRFLAPQTQINAQAFSTFPRPPVPSRWLDAVPEQRPHAGLGGGPLRRNISMDEVAQHRTQEDAWLAYNGKVLFRARSFWTPTEADPALTLLRAPMQASITPVETAMCGP